MTPEGLQSFINLFRGRGDCYGSWDGSCIRRPLTRDQFANHLSTGPFIGVYPNLGDKVSWGCVDIDFDDLQLARNLRTILKVKGIQAWTEKTRKGYHVWVFPDVPLVPAADMRRMLQAACKVIGYDPKEINPKQEELPKGKVGNYVRLPHPGGDAATERRFVDQPYSRCDAQFIHIDKRGRSAAATIAELAKLYTPPAKVNLTQLDVGAGLEVENLTPLLTGLAYTIWEKGPLDGADRSNTLAHLAHLLVDQLAPDAALAVLNSADLRWGKFNAKGTPEHLVGLIEHAVSKKEG